MLHLKYILFLPPSRLEVPPGARPRSCSQIPPPYPLRAESKLATRDCTINAIWLSSRPGRERRPLVGPRIRHCITWGGGQSVNCLPWGRKQALELPSPPPRPRPRPRPLLPLGRAKSQLFPPQPPRPWGLGVGLLPSNSPTWAHSSQQPLPWETGPLKGGEKSRSLLSTEVPDAFQNEEKLRHV